MQIKKYEEMDAMQQDVMREVGSIGTGNAATALSAMLSKTVKMTVPDVRILDYNAAVRMIGDPEEIIAGVLVHMSGDINGIMLYLQKLEFINVVLQQTCGKQIADYSMLGDLERSALEEVGNIMISSYVNAMAKLTDMSINLSVPSLAVNMLGGIMTVPMAELGYQTDKVMIIDGKFIGDYTELSSNLLMMPEMDSLNHLLEKLGICHG